METPSNMNLSDTQVPRVIGSNSAAYALVVIAVSLRFLARRVVRAGLWWDDYLILLPLVLITVVYVTSMAWLVPNGFARHVEVAGFSGVTIFLKALFLSEICYTVSITVTKFSILAFYWRLFAVNGIHLSIYILGGISLAWGIANLFVNIFQCTPVEGFWDKTIDPTCGVNTVAFFYGQSIPNILTDVAILALPAFYISDLHVSKWNKVLLLGIFMTGGLVIAISITRFVYLTQLNLTSEDVTWNFVNVQIWTTLEMDMAVISACLPSLRPLLSLILPGFPGSTRGQGSSTTGSGLRKSNMTWRSSRAWAGTGISTSKTASYKSPPSASSDDHDLIPQGWKNAYSHRELQRSEKEESHNMELRDMEMGTGIMVQNEFEVRHH